jgi:hypothetical protein
MPAQPMTADDYVVDDDSPVAYSAQARRQSGAARSAAGMAPYPLYGIGQVTATAAVVPFYRTQWFSAALAGGGVAALWVYFGWWRPRHERMKKNKKNRKRFVRAGNED